MCGSCGSEEGCDSCGNCKGVECGSSPEEWCDSCGECPGCLLDRGEVVGLVAELGSNGVDLVLVEKRVCGTCLAEAKGAV